MATITIHKLIIGLTGNIATGKSAVLRLAETEGALVIDADKIVHDLLNHDAEMQAAIALAFGPDVRREDGRIDRRALGDVVFQDENALHDLELMIHPAVRRIVLEQVHQSDAAIVFIEAIKLLEGDLAAACDQIWVTRCSPKRQLQRLVICRGLDQETAQQRVEAQPPQNEKVAQADVVIDTDGLMQNTEAQFEQAWSRLPDLASVEAKTLTLPDATPPSFPDKTDGATTAVSKPTPAAPVAPAPRPKSAPKSDSPLSAAAPLPPTDRPDDLEIRRARPSDIPSILLLMQQATDGAIKMKRSDLLMSLGERSYFIGQRDGEVKAVLGWNIESLVASVDQIYIHPPEETAVVGAAILEEIETSANQHVAQIIVIFLPANATPELKQLIAGRNYNAMEDVKQLPKVWQNGIKEHQPEGTDFYIRVLRERN